MTPGTPLPAINNTNNNTSIEGELPWSQTDNDEDNHVFAHVTVTILRLKSEDVSDLDDWMKYHHYSSLQDNICEYFSSPHDFHLHTNYKKIGVTTAPPNLASHDSKLLLDGWLSSTSTTMVIFLTHTCLYSQNRF